MASCWGGINKLWPWRVKAFSFLFGSKKRYYVILRPLDAIGDDGMWQVQFLLRNPGPVLPDSPFCQQIALNWNL